jgi:lipoprotein-releasing system permease protein
MLFLHKINPLNVAAFIARRIAFSRQQHISRFIVRISTTATAISVAIMIITIAFAGGFQQTISQKVFSFFGHIRIQDYNALRLSLAEEVPIRMSDSIFALKKQHPEVVQVQGYAIKNALLRTAESMEGILFKGVGHEYDFRNLQPFLVAGRWIRFTDSGYSTEINLSESLARSLRLKVNDAVLILFIQPNGEAPRPRKLTVAGIFKTGIEEYDKVFAIGDLQLVRKLNNWPDATVGGYEVILKDPMQMDAVSNALFPDLPEGLGCQTIREIIPSLFDWLYLQNKTIYIVLLIMALIAVLNLITCLLILLLERTRMVGVLKAVGTPPGTLRRIFLFQGTWIAVIGILTGTIAGLLVCWLQERYGLIKLPEESYYISQAAVYLHWWQVALVIAGTFLLCLVVLILPASIVRKIPIVRAIQFR